MKQCGNIIIVLQIINKTKIKSRIYFYNNYHLLFWRSTGLEKSRDNGIGTRILYQGKKARIGDTHNGPSITFL